MNSTLYKRRRLRQKPHILTIEQSRELGRLAGNKLLRNVTDPGLIPNNLYRLRKRKLELIYKYLSDRHLIHGKEPEIELMQTHQLAEYLLHTIYPGYPSCKAKNLAYADYRLCREKDLGPIPLAYDFVPTTEVYDRLDELYRIDVEWQEDMAKLPCIEIATSSLRKSMDRIRGAHSDKCLDHVEFHMYFWNSTKTLVKPTCRSLKLNSKEIWSHEKEKTVAEGFMHIDITEKIKELVSKKTYKSSLTTAEESKEMEDNTLTVFPTLPENSKTATTDLQSVINSLPKKTVPITTSKKAVPITLPSRAVPIELPKKTPSSTLSTHNENDGFLLPPPPMVKRERKLKLQIELGDNDDYNISHISITAVIKKTTDELVNALYLQTTVESIAKSLQTSLCPSDTQQIAVHLLKQYHASKGDLKAAENIFLTCLSNSESFTSSEDEEPSEEEYISLLDPISHKRIQHPVKSFHCKHRSPFDAAIFFDSNADIKIWHCPICFVHIKNMEELRIDYQCKVALAQYPDEEKLYLQDVLLSETGIFGEEQDQDLARSVKRTFIICDNDEEDVDEENHHSQKRYRALVM